MKSVNISPDDQKISFQAPIISKTSLIKSFIKGPNSRRNFTKEEDARLLYLVEHFGTKNWHIIAEMMPFRNIRQCRDRFRNYLSPEINLKPWTLEEDLLLASKYKELGPKWVQISQFFQGRSDNNLKNRWYTHLRNKYEYPEWKPKEPEIINQDHYPLTNFFEEKYFDSEFLYDELISYELNSN